jgi:DNA-binding transcriptional LysR family regulator
MNFQQLRILLATVQNNFNLTEVANALYTAQSGVSKHIKDLEDELGVEIFVRRGKRLIGLTEPGQLTRATPVDPEGTEVDTVGVHPELVEGLR